MPTAQIQEKIAQDELSAVGQDLEVSAMTKLQRFPMLQELGYNGQLKHLQKDFHGLKEFLTHMNMYSLSNIILTAAWNIIKSLVPSNPFLELLMFTSGALGKVGLLFQSIHNFDKVFSLNTTEASNLSAIKDKISNVV